VAGLGSTRRKGRPTRAEAPPRECNLAIPEEPFAVMKDGGLRTEK
jgi:hypothetical protein